MDNIILIGMPASGKSTVGFFLARALGWAFLDSDREIERRRGQKLSRLARELGAEGFRALEEEVNASLDVHRTVIAPGGSVIYEERAMRHLRSLGSVVYLRFAYETIAGRLGDLGKRGVSMKPGQTLRDLYNERCPLYEKHADLTVDADGLLPREIIAIIRERLGLAEADPTEPNHEREREQNE